MTRSESGYDPTPTNEEWEANISALFDGELDRDTTLDTVDKLLLNPELQRFYREARLLHKEFDWKNTETVTLTTLPTGLWKKIEKKGLNVPQKVWGMPASSFRWLAAASVILFLTVTVAKVDWSSVLFHITRMENKGPIQIELGEGNNNMTEDRFMAMTAELLQSDKRFHWKMLEILQQVTETKPNAERNLRHEETASTLNEKSKITPSQGS